MALNYELTTLHNIVEKKIDPRIIATKNVDEDFYKTVILHNTVIIQPHRIKIDAPQYFQKLFRNIPASICVMKS